MIKPNNATKEILYPCSQGGMYTDKTKKTFAFLTQVFLRPLVDFSLERKKTTTKKNTTKRQRSAFAVDVAHRHVATSKSATLIP